MRQYLYLILLNLLPFAFESCSSGTYKELQKLPEVCSTYNLYNYTVQNMDNTGQTNVSHLSVLYDGFEVVYQLNKNLQMTFYIENKTNKSLIIDKSKSYVLVDGYSKELFRDVRSSRNTTFNNVQDAINNVQTNEGGQILTIPPYSKWQLPLEETNVGAMKIPDIEWQQGRYEYTQYTTNNTIEFVIPYTFDYALAKWDTSRNRLFIGSIDVEKRLTYPYNISSTIETGWEGSTYYKKGFYYDDLKEYNRVVAYNREVKSHNSNIEDRKVMRRVWGIAVGILGGVVLVSLIPALIF